MVSLEVSIRSGEVTLPGELTLPSRATGLVLFAHGSGSSRYSARNRHVAEVLNESGLGTLLFDLLTVEEERAERVSAHLRFDVELLAQRLLDATVAVFAEREVKGLPLGYFGAGTGAAAALFAAAQRPELITAVVSRSGRPDLVSSTVLSGVHAPTLFVVGEKDRAVLSVNRRAVPQMRIHTELRTVAGAGQQFEEPGALDRVANLARDWFDLHLATPSPDRPLIPSRLPPHQTRRLHAP